ncbi:MAG: hypothetical protein E6K16_02470 [Methanobacteriota archaeon]|nr:MAG: hypothetical protein E6K16_02470 [Euryarchaeota archaeon]
MTVDRPVAAPGDGLAFTITVAAIPGRTAVLAINDSAPAGLRVTSSTEPSICSRTDTTWSCTPNGETTISVVLRAVVDESARGRDLLSRAWISARSQEREVGEEEEGEHHSDDGGGGGQTTWVSAEVVVQVIASNISIRLGASQSVATPGGSLNYRIEVVNVGAGPAVNARVVARLPADVTSDSVFPRPTTIDGDRLEWAVTEIPVGTRVYLFNASFRPATPVGQILASAAVTYVDSNGDTPQILETGLNMPVAALPPGASADTESAAPLGTIGMMLAAAGVGLALVQRFVLSPRSVRLRIDQMFLLHRSGLVLKHFSARGLVAGDPDIQGAMLTAVQSYLENAVDASAGPLRQITFGGRDIIFANGPNAILAAVVRRGDPGVFFARAPGFLADLENRTGTTLANWDGVEERLHGVEGAFRTFTKELIAHRGS